MKFYTVLLLTLISLQLTAQVDFVAETYQVGTFGVLRNCVVDMNGDFKDDIVGVTPNRIDIAYQTEDGFEFVDLSKDLQKFPLWSICAGDIDANGYNDLMIGDADRVSFLYADANGSDYNEVVGDEFIFCQRTTFVDINDDGDLDAFVCNDVGGNHSYINDGDGNFNLDLDLVPTPPTTPGNYISTWVDYDNDDDLDVYFTKCFSDVTNVEARLNLLYNNDGQGNFTEVGAAAGMDDNAQSWVTLFEDFDNDGDFDAYTLNHTQTNRMRRNNGDGTFTEIIQNTGLNAIPFPQATEALAVDFDNDGDMDIMTSFPQTIFYNNGDMTFVTVPTDVVIGALGDLNNDGFMDMVAVDKIYVNQKNDNHWIKINPIGRTSNRNAIGARMSLYGDWGRQVKELRSSASWTPMSTLSMHFGIGQHTSIDSLVIEWPSGLRTVINNPAIDQALFVDELDCPVGLVEVEVSGNLTLCANESVTLTAPTGDSYEWSNGETTQQISVSTTGRFNVRVIDANGCDRFTSIVEVVSESEPLIISTPDGTEFCQGTPIRLTVDSDNAVQWSTGETTKTIWVTTPGQYTAIVLNDCGDLITTEIVNLTEVIPDTPEEETIFITTGSSLSIELSVSNGQIIWWSEAVGGTFLGSDIFDIDNVTEDVTYYAENVIMLASGETCRSPRVPITISVIDNGTTGYSDNDGDSFGDINSPIVFTTPTAPAGVVLNADDCDDTRANVFPGATEICDNLDNDCNGSIDEDLPTTLYFIDEDQDGYGAMSSPVESCLTAVTGFVTNNADCDDSDPTINPDAIEIEGNDIDENCNGSLTSTHDLSGLRINVYPSPVTDFLFVEYSAPAIVEIKLYDLQGRLHLSEHNSQRLDVSALPEGTYLLTLRNEETGEQVTDRVVVVR